MNGRRMKILIADDGSEHSAAAIEDLRKAGLPTNVRAVVLSTVDVWVPPDAIPSLEPVAATPDNTMEVVARRAGHRRLRAERRLAFRRAGDALKDAYAVAAQGAERIQELFPDWEVRVEAGAGSPASRIIRRAQRWKADLIVVGSQGRSALGRFFMGSVSQKVVTEAQCSVRVARRSIRPNDRAVRIIVGVDGLDGSDAAVNAVAARIWPEGSEARIVSVFEPLRPTLAGRVIPVVSQWTEETTEEEQIWARQKARTARDRLEAAGLTVSILVQSGDPKRLLVEAAENWNADCIFVGARGLKGIERFLLGSVSGAVASRASCSVEIIRSPIPSVKENTQQ